MVRNRHGLSVDPVPFLVVSGLGMLVWYSSLPPTLVALGFPLSHSLVFSTVGVIISVLGTYYYLVWTVTPGGHATTQQLMGVGYGLLAIVALLLALGLLAS
ncbi:hypothetical protein [Haladaptatus sp. NG-SE-30]